MSTYEDFEDDTVTLTFDDDKEVECGIVAIFPAGEREYIALLPLGGEEEVEDDPLQPETMQEAMQTMLSDALAAGVGAVDKINFDELVFDEDE